MHERKKTRNRAVTWGIVLGVVIGVLLSKALEGLPRVNADGEGKGKTEAKETHLLLRRQADTFRAAAQRINPSVVNITTIEKVTFVERSPRDLFGGFFRFYRKPRLREGRRVRGIGSGFIFDAQNGYVLTNNHVVEGGKEWVVRLGDKRELRAHLVGADPQTDVAVLQIKAKGLHGATLGDSDKIQVGDWVLAAGNPFGMLEQTVTQGIISAKGRKGLGLSNYESFLQTDAAINPGNSGGPLVNLYGEVIGIDTAIYSKTGGYQGIGFAIPINQAKTIAKKLIRDGRVVRGWMGIQFVGVPEKQARQLGLAKGKGLLVDGVILNGPSHRGGIRPNDIVLSIGGRKVGMKDKVGQLVANLKPGSSIKVTVMRPQRFRYVKRELEVTLSAQPKGWETTRR